MKERRVFPRFAAEGEVEITILSAPAMPDLDGRVLHSSTSDVSLRGVHLQAELPLPVGTTLKLQLKLPRQPAQFRHSGRVMWCRAAGKGQESIVFAGVEFEVASNPDFAAWRAAILRMFEEVAN